MSIIIQSGKNDLREANQGMQGSKHGHKPIKKSVEIKEDKIVLYREKLVVAKHVSYNEVDEIIDKLQDYFKERMIVFYKCSKEYSKDIDEPV
ncbi:MAG: hypothetical protein ACTSQ2_12845, partial [Candidatus Heimdallarchaeaceae archaeon]